MEIEPLMEKVTLEYPLIPYVITPHLAYIRPVVEQVKQRDVQAECFLDFEVNKVDIRPEYMNNPKELGKIRAMIIWQAYMTFPVPNTISCLVEKIGQAW